MIDRTLPRPASGAFGAAPEADIPDQLFRRIRRSILVGCLIAVAFVIGLGVWATLSPVAGAVSAPGVVRVENNRKTVKHLESGLVRQILVHEGDHVARGQLLFVFDDIQPKSQLAILQSAFDSFEAEHARFEAEAQGRATIQFPADLLARRGDPSVAASMASQEALFQARRDTLRSQLGVGHQREQELGQQIAGLQAQLTSVQSQMALNKSESEGVQSLYQSGYAPRTRVLNLQRSEASLGGSRGQLLAQIAQVRQSIGEVRVQSDATRQTRIAEAAAGLESSQDKMSDLAPRLAAAREALDHTRVTSPADGYVLNLTQYTEGGVVAAGEPLLDVVPSNEPLVIEAKVDPRDAHAVRPGQKALVTLIAYNTQKTPRIDAEVITLSADQTVDQHTGKAYFTAQLRIPPDQLKRLPREVKIYPGMPVSSSIVNGERSIMSYIFGPLKDAFGSAMHEQ